MQFEKRYVDFGTIQKGDKREYTYIFTNKGDTDLIIDLVSACDCTETEWPSQAIKPGEKGKIDIVFDSSEKEEEEVIDVDIILRNEVPDSGGEPIIERVQYHFDLE
ncbi:MAG: DUF1573 domain-containing protein [Bacteroidetes bacterium]|nr:DUF1573 domain-containing protein [Bacteroidota bacterium]